MPPPPPMSATAVAETEQLGLPVHVTPCVMLRDSVALVVLPETVDELTLSVPAWFRIPPPASPSSRPSILTEQLELQDADWFMCSAPLPVAVFPETVDEVRFTVPPRLRIPPPAFPISRCVAATVQLSVQLGETVWVRSPVPEAVLSFTVELVSERVPVLPMPAPASPISCSLDTAEQLLEQPGVVVDVAVNVADDLLLVTV